MRFEPYCFLANFSSFFQCSFCKRGRHSLRIFETFALSSLLALLTFVFSTFASLIILFCSNWKFIDMQGSSITGLGVLKSVILGILEYSRVIEFGFSLKAKVFESLSSHFQFNESSSLPIEFKLTPKPQANLQLPKTILS